MATRPTKNPRIAFVPSDRLDAVIRELSEASGKSRASIVSGLMDEIAPVLQGQLDAFRKIAAQPDEAKKIIEGYANEGMAQIAQAQLDLERPKQKPGRKPGGSGAAKPR